MQANVEAGRLDTRIGLMRPVQTVSATGAHVVIYAEPLYVWANVRQLTLRENMKAQVQLQSETYTVLMRYRAGISPDWAVELHGRRYRIISINASRSEGQMILGIELDNSIAQEVTT